MTKYEQAKLAHVELMKRYDKIMAEARATIEATERERSKPKFKAMEYQYQEGEKGGLILIGIVMFLLLGLSRLKFLLLIPWRLV
jgi:hypothetical protein